MMPRSYKALRARTPAPKIEENGFMVAKILSFRGVGVGRRSQQMFQCLHRSLRCPHLRAQSFCSSAAQRNPFCKIRNQFHERKRKLRWTNHTNRIAALKQAHNVPEVFGMVAYHDRNSMQCGLDYIVSATRNEAATNKCNISERVECSQFADRIDQ